MSLLTSVFDVIHGWPNGSALQYSFKEKDSVSAIGEGTVVAVEDESGVPVVDRHTSALDASGNTDNPWLVVRGKDQTDGVTSDKLSCVKLRSGVMFRVAFTEAALPGDPVYANAGVLTLTDPGSAPLLGRVVEYNSLQNWVTVES